MSGRRAWEFGYSPHLPPADAWKQPDKWIDTRMGLPLSDAKKIQLPVDDRNLLKPGESVEMVNEMLFWPDYDWSEGSGLRMKGDVHHFYHPARAYEPSNHEGVEVPHVFRELPTMMGRMPRQFHNTLHSFTEIPAMPSYEVMERYTQSYLLARQAFTNLIRLAESTVDASRRFKVREQDLASGRITPHDPSDTIGKEILKDFFARHFSAYAEIAELVRELPERDIVAPNINEVHLTRPHLVVRKLGRKVISKHVNYIPYLMRMG